MPFNRELTKLIKGRRVRCLMPSPDYDGTWELEFDDAARMRIKTGDSPPTLPTDLQSPIQSVHQNEVMIQFDLENNESLAFPLAEPTSSVLLRDMNGAFEYAD